MNMRFDVIYPRTELHVKSQCLPRCARTTDELGVNHLHMFRHVLGTMRENLKPLASRTIPPRLVSEQERVLGIMPVSRLSGDGER